MRRIILTDRSGRELPGASLAIEDLLVQVGRETFGPGPVVLTSGGRAVEPAPAVMGLAAWLPTYQETLPQK